MDLLGLLTTDTSQSPRVGNFRILAAAEFVEGYYLGFVQLESDCGLQIAGQAGVGSLADLKVGEWERVSPDPDVKHQGVEPGLDDSLSDLICPSVVKQLAICNTAT